MNWTYVDSDDDWEVAWRIAGRLKRDAEKRGYTFAVTVQQHAHAYWVMRGPIKQIRKAAPR